MVFEKLKECPACHERFHTEEVKREILGTDTNEKQDTIPKEFLRYAPPDLGTDSDEHVQTFKVTYKCKHCGHEWHDLVQKKY